MGEHRRKALAPATGSAWLPAVAAVARPRWDGHAVVGCLAMAWFYGDLPAQWLSTRGIHLDVCKIYERYELADRVDFGVRPELTPSVPLLFDMVSVGCVPMGSPESKPPGLRLLISVDDDLWHVPPWHRPQWDADPDRRSRFEAFLRAADGIIVPSVRLGERVRPFSHGALPGWPTGTVRLILVWGAGALPTAVTLS